MPWKIILSNNETIIQDESKPGHWSEVANYCKNNKLAAKQLYYNDELIEPEADDYFIIFDIVGFLDGTQEIKMGLGSYIDNDKRSRIRWVPIEGNPQ